MPLGYGVVIVVLQHSDDMGTYPQNASTSGSVANGKDSTNSEAAAIDNHDVNTYSHNNKIIHQINDPDRPCPKVNGWNYER